MDTWRQMADRYNTTVEDIKTKLPLEWVVVVAAGIKMHHSGEGRLQGLCPFHSDSDPSFDIYGYGERWGCFPCGRGGDIFDFVGEYWELQSFDARFEKAYDLLTEYKGAEEGWKALIESSQPPPPVSVADLSKEVQAAHDFIERHTSKPVLQLLERKGIDQIDLGWLQRTWKVGVTPKGEVLAPYWDTDGKLISYKTRFPGRGGWYARKGARLTSLYGEWQLTGDLAEAPIWLCEGETDTWLASWLLRGRGIALGLPAGASSRISPEWAEIMRDKRVTLVMDADKAGRTAARRWWDHTNSIAREVSIAFPESDLCDSKEPEKVLFSGKIVTSTSGFVTERPDGRAYLKVTRNGPGDVLSNFVFSPTKRIDYRDSVGSSVVEGFEGFFADQQSKIVRVRSTDFTNASTLRDWAVTHGRSWSGSSPQHSMAVLEELQAQAPFLKEEIAVPVAGLWGWEGGQSVFVLPEGAGGSIGSAIAREKWSFNEGFAKYDLSNRFRLQSRDNFEVSVLKSLLKLNKPAVTTPMVAWMTAAPLRSMVREFPPLAVLGGSGSGKTTFTLAVMKLFWGWQGSEQNLTNTTPYAVKQASAATNGLPIWWDEYRRGARKDTFQAVGQVIRDSWTGSASQRGGMGEDLSKVEVTAAVAPLVLSGEAGLEERSHQDRVIVLRLVREGQNAEALGSVLDNISATGGGVLGRRLVDWQLRMIDAGDALLVNGAPERRDRQEQGVAVLEWGWEMWKRFLMDEFGVVLQWDLDTSEVTAQREGTDDFPEITALWEALQLGAKERSGDPYPVAWVEDAESDIVAVRSRAFYRWASSAGYELPGGEKATNDLIKERYGLLSDHNATWCAFEGGVQKRVRAYRIVGLMNHAQENGVTIESQGGWLQ